jgi:hypothetical protein
VSGNPAWVPVTADLTPASWCGTGTRRTRITTSVTTQGRA